MKYLILLIITNGFSYVASILLSHLYSAEQFGIIIGYITIANLISLLASLGIHEYSLRELSQNETPLDLSSILLSLVITAVLSLAWPVPNDQMKVLLFAVSFPSVLIAYSCVILKYRSRVIELALTQKIVNIYKVLLLLVTAILLFGFAQEINNPKAVTISNIIVLASVTAYFIYHIKKYKKYYNFKITNFGFKKKSLNFLISDLSYLFTYQAAILIMGQMGMNKAVATYSLSTLLLSSCGLLINALFNSMLLSNFYKLFSDNKEQAFSFVEKYIRYGIVAALPVTIILFFAVGLIYPLLFDTNKYPDLIRLTSLFVFPIVIKLLYSPIGMTMNLEAIIVFKNKVLIIVGALTVISTYFLSKSFGVEGALYAFGISELVILFAYIFGYNQLKKKETL